MMVSASEFLGFDALLSPHLHFVRKLVSVLEPVDSLMSLLSAFLELAKVGHKNGWIYFRNEPIGYIE